MNKHVDIIENENVSYLDKILLDESGLYQSVPAQVLRYVPHRHLQIWATNNGVYQFVTDEMIAWLRDEIGESKAIEIGAGTGAISRTLGITGTDMYLHLDPLIKAYYELMGQQITIPPPDILKYEGLQAVRMLKPQTVVGAFITQWGTEEEARQGIGCSMFGVQEIEMLKIVKKYICFGNAHTHKGKRIFAIPHREYRFEWLVTKAFDQSLNRVWVWENE